MSKMIQIRNVPDEVHRKLKVKAAKEGLSLSDLLLREATRVADTPTIQEWIEMVRADPPVAGLTAQQIVDDIRAEREGR